MKIVIENTIEQYRKLWSLKGKRKNYFRYKMMKPLEDMWNTINVPLKAKEVGGYDVIMATQMLGFLDIDEITFAEKALKDLEKMNALEMAETTLKDCLDFSYRHGLKIDAEELRLGIYIGNPKKLETQYGYTGFGGVPGYIMTIIYPNDYNIPRFPALIAHEFHHNLRFSYFDWDHGNVSVGDYIVIEGLADSFATSLYGEEYLGPWVTSIDDEELEYSIYVIGEGLNVKGFDQVSSYMFGDEHANEKGYQPVGLSAGAGYAVGYHAVQSFIQKNNVTIQEATLLRTDEIIDNCGLFAK